MEWRRATRNRVTPSKKTESEVAMYMESHAIDKKHFIH